MNREQNDWVSFLKEPMEFVFNPSNHLIGIGPKLDGNTLHNKASSWEWTTIFYLNWLTCSTRSVRPLYMANVGWWKRLGSFALSIPRVKGDFEIWLNAFFITSFPTPLWERLLRFLWWKYSSSQEKDSLGGVLERCLYTVSSSSLEETSELEGYCFCFAWRSLLFQIINLSLHGFLITLLMSYMTFPSKTTPVRMNIVHAAFLIIFSISLMFKIVKFILLTNIGRFRLVQTSLMRTWFRHNR